MHRMRTFVLGMTATFLLGCKTPPPGMDPFLRTRVPPPSSGEAAPLYNDSYGPAQPAAPLNSPGAETYQPPASGSQPGTSSAPGQTPYGRENFPARFRTSASWDATPLPQAANGGEPLEVDLATGAAERSPGSIQLAAGTASAGSASDVVTAEYQSEIRILTPETPPDGDLEASGRPGPVSQPHSAAPQQNERMPYASPQRVSRPAPSVAADARTETRTAAANSSAPYAYDPSYAWLRGKLEYSQRDRRWKLRYIPIDGNTDQYGGSVVLTNPQKLEGFEPGEFVEVRGVLAGSVGREPFAPAYRIEQITPQSM